MRIFKLKGWEDVPDVHGSALMNELQIPPGPFDINVALDLAVDWFVGEDIVSM